MAQKLCRPLRDRSYKIRKRPAVSSKDSSTSGERTTRPPKANARSSNSVRKGPLYHNAMLEAPDGQPLCVCDEKKARWYVKNDLGKIVKEDPFTVKLNFEPAGRPEGNAGDYYLVFKVKMMTGWG